MNLPEKVKRGQIVETLYRQMKGVARLVIIGGKTFGQARELTLHFAALWERYDALGSSSKASFSDVENWGLRRDDPVLPKREDILETIGSSFFGDTAPGTVASWRKAFRKWRQTRNKLQPK